MGRRARAQGKPRAQPKGPAGASASLPRPFGGHARRTGGGHRGLARATASGQSGDRPGHHKARHHHARGSRHRVPRLGGARVGDDLPADLPGRLGRPARARGPAHPHLHAPAVATDRLLREPSGGGVDLAHDQRHRGSRQPRDRLRGDAVPVGADAARDDRDPDHPRPHPGTDHLLHLPVRPRRLDLVPPGLRRRLPAHARDDRRDHRLSAGDAVGHPRRAQLRAGALPRGTVRRAERGQPRGQHGHRSPQRDLLPRR